MPPDNIVEATVTLGGKGYQPSLVEGQTALLTFPRKGNFFEQIAPAGAFLTSPWINPGASRKGFW